LSSRNLAACQQGRLRPRPFGEMCSCSRNIGTLIPAISPSHCHLGQNIPDPEPISDPRESPFAQHPPPPPPPPVLLQTLYPDHPSKGTLYAQQHPTVIYDSSVMSEDLMFRAVAERSDLRLLDLRDVVVGCLRSWISSSPLSMVKLTFMVD
jgi:hypothetical protein